MKQITNKEYEEWLKYKSEKNQGKILAPDIIRFICESYHYDANQIGQHFLDMLPNIPNNTASYRHYIFIIQDYLFANGKISSEAQIIEVDRRKNGKKYSIEAHIKGMVYALLSNQTPWIRIEPHLSEIDSLFADYDPSFIIDKPASYFIDGLLSLRCGNRNVEAQMKALSKNIEILRHIKKDYGSIDSFVVSEPPQDIVKKLSAANSAYKLKQMGEALTWEYLRNVGVDGAKPDTHLLRFLGANRMGTCNHSPATLQEFYTQMRELSDVTGLSLTEVDYIIWNFCAEGFGEVCTKSPRCSICPVRNECNYNRKG